MLIITYYWPPSGGAGVQRCLKLTKYLRQFGWEPVIYTADNAQYPVIDNSLEKDIPIDVKVIKHKITEPYDLYKMLIGQKKKEKVYSGFLSENEKPSIAQKLSVWIRGNVFIPDARMFWIKPSIKFLLKTLQNDPVDAIISSGPPHSTHLIAKGVHDRLKIPWIADFRDPWTQIDFYHQLMLTKWADNKNKRLERSVLRTADRVTCVSRHWAEDLEKIGERKVDVIPNGFDEDDFPHSDEKRDEKFSFTHIGSLNADRNPHSFWAACKELSEEYPNFKEDLKIRLVGKNDIAVYKSIEQAGLNDNLERIDYLPHNEVNDIYAKSQILLLPLNDTPNVLGIIPGKLFEYLAAKRPILCIGPENGDSAKIIEEANAGVVNSFTDIEGMKKKLLSLYTGYKAGTLSVDPSGIQKYTRKNIAGQFAEVLNKAILKP